jgi:hypothetical protein
MRLVLRFSMLLAVGGLVWSQAITDAAAVVAGGSVGTGAGKKVSEGITSVVGKVDSTAAKAAAPSKAQLELDEEKRLGEKPSDRAAAKPSQKASAGDSSGSGGTMLKTSPGGVVKDHSLVPPPPAKKVAVVPPPPPLTPPTPVVLTPVFVPPPPPQATPEDLKTIASGASRAEVLRLGAPSSRITMFDDGHLVEIFRYQSRDTTFGIVRLSDGSVSSVQVR